MKDKPRGLRMVAALLGLTTAALGFIALAGWVLDIPSFKGVVSTLVPMKANTAIAMMLCGGSLTVLAGQTAKTRYIVSTISLVVIALAAATLSQDLVGWNLHIDEFLFRDFDGARGQMRPGRMSPAVSLSFLLTGIGCLLLSRLHFSRLQASAVTALASSVLLIGSLGIVGQAATLVWHASWWGYAIMAPNTAAGFVLLGIGLLGLAFTKQPFHWSLNRAITGGFAIGIASLLLATTVSYNFTSQLHQSAADVSKTQETLKEIEDVKSDFAQLESIQRGYIILGELQLLANRGQLAASLHDHIRRLRNRTSGSSSQQERLDRLEPLAISRNDFSQRTIDARRDSGFEAAQRLVASGKGISLTAEINRILMQMEGDEYSILRDRISNSNSVAASTFLLLPLGTFLALTVSLFGLFLLNSDAVVRRRATAALRESDEKYRQLIEQASDGIFTLDVNGKFEFLNPKANILFGYASGELLGLDSSVTYIEAERHIPAERIRQAQSGELIRYSRGVQRKDGSTFSAEFSGRKLDNGTFQIAFHDVTDRLRAASQLKESEEKFRNLIEQASDGIFISDAEGRFVMVNSAGCALLGYTKTEMIGMDGRATYLEDERDIHTMRMQEIRAGAVLRFERMVKRKDGSAFPAEISVKKLDDGLVQVIFRDISERRQNEEKIARLNRIKAVLSGINSAIVRIHDRTALLQEACRIAAMHGAFRIAWIGMLDATGVTRPAVWAGVGSEFFDEFMRDPRSIALNPRGVATTAMVENRTVVDNDITTNPALDHIRRQAIERGCQSVVALPLHKEETIAGALVLYSGDKNTFDEEELKLLEELAGDVSFALTFIAQQERVNYLAYYDTLTGLPNRALFFDRLGQQIAAAGRENRRVALLLLDVDRFRMINDTLGRQSGDALLKAIAERIKGVMRDEDTVARLGGDGFSIAASGTWRPQELAHIVESRNQELFRKPFTIGSEELRVSATAGIALFPEDSGNAEALVAHAEAALRSAKEQSVPLMFYGPEMNAQAAESLRLENRLRGALEQKELVLWYQPKIDAKTGKVNGFEALMRWIDPQLGVISPAKFIPIMEQTGLILEAGNWALSQVARDCTEWGATTTKPRIAVNVSPLQLQDKMFVGKVIEAAAELERVGGILDLEITESVIMENVDAIIAKLQTLRGLGIRIFIDDFGTGYSSLAYIARLPIHALKIDRSFVVGMTQNDESLTIVNSVISLAHSLKLRVVAEGVETQEQADLLGNLGCDELQGYLFGRPTPSKEVASVLQAFSADPAGKQYSME